MGYVHNITKEKCSRGDNFDLTETWLKDHENSNAVFAINNGDLDKVDENTEYLLGIKNLMWLMAFQCYCLRFI